MNLVWSLFLAFAVVAGLSSTRAMASVCAFGATTGDLEEMLIDSANPKVWYEGDHFNLNQRQRIEGLKRDEKRILLDVLGGNYDSENEAFEEIARSEGYMTFFSHANNGKDYVLVGHYPGDNEFGAIVEVTKGPDEDLKIRGWVAVINDGDIDDCKVTK